MKARQQPLSRLRRCWVQYPQLVTNVKVREKVPFEQLKGVLELVGQAQDQLAREGGRVLLRYSGTEPKARLLLEGSDHEVLQNWSKQICDAIQRQVGA
jgi:phosphoglucosamine mutase